MKTLSQLRGKNGSYDCRFKTKKDDSNKETALLKLNDVGNYQI